MGRIQLVRDITNEVGEVVATEHVRFDVALRDAGVTLRKSDVRVFVFQGGKEDHLVMHGWVSRSFPGLAVTPDAAGRKNRWAVTHIASGKSVIADMPDRKTAVCAAVDFADTGTDWLMSEKGVQAASNSNVRAVYIEYRRRSIGH